MVTTETYYIKTDNQDVRDAMVSFEQNLDKKISIENVPDTNSGSVN